jgi:hypothetical protein
MRSAPDERSAGRGVTPHGLRVRKLGSVFSQPVALAAGCQARDKDAATNDASPHDRPPQAMSISVIAVRHSRSVA